MKPFILLILASALLLPAGCSNDGADDFNPPASVTLLTRGTTETAAAHRLLVFPASGNADCLLNYSFSSGNAVTLSRGSYRFVTLTESACFDLPAAGTTAGLGFDNLMPLKDGAVLEAVQVSRPTEVILPGTASYTASLKPATSLLKLQLEGIPEGFTLQLANMYGGIPFSGTYAADAPVMAYSVGKAENICLPTRGSAVLQYRYGEETGTLDLGMAFEPGYTYSAQLQWQDAKLTVTSFVEKWMDGDETVGDAE